MTMSEPDGTRFESADRLAEILADQIAGSLHRGIEARGLASLVVSGGKSPVKMFEVLCAKPLEWRRVCVALADERWVEPSDPASNEHLVRTVLLQKEAAPARFLGLKNSAATPAIGAVSAWETFARVPRPFDVVVLGMGDDGHTASLFPRSPNLTSALDASAVAGCIGMWAPVVPHPRMSLNLSALLDARRIVLLLQGDAKWRTYVTAAGDGPVQDMPVRAVLRQTRTPVEVMWAP